MAVSRGYHFFQNPGPTNIPDRILRAMDRGTIDFTGAQFKAIAEECFAGLKRVFKTEQTILGYAASGHGAWEAALVNLFSPGDKVLVVETGYFSLNWGMRCEAFGLEVETLANDWRHRRRPGQRSKAGCARTASTRSRPCWSCTTKPRPASSTTSPRCAARSTPPGIRRCSSSM